MEILQAIILGAIQGLTEFIPISSSGHLVLTREIFNWEDPGIIFDIILHLGTLMAVIIYFRKDWIKIFKDLIDKKSNNNLLLLLILATIPTFIVGYLLNDYIESIFRDALWVAAFMIIIGLIFLLAEKYSSIKLEKKDLTKSNWKDAILIGLFQIFSLLPGVSRSGMTISAGLFRSLKRTESTRFLFLIAAVAISGASLYGLFNLFQDTDSKISYLPLLFGFLVSFSLGYISIKYLMKFLENHRLNVFAYYVIAAGIIIFIIRWI
jgi:undecaprenyl-diphosphatase